MEQNVDFMRLEQFVEKLIDRHNQLQHENSEINALLQEKQQEIAALQEEIRNLQEDRSLMYNRVTGLIDRIGEWEKAFDRDNPGPKSNMKGGDAQNPPKKSSSLFKVTKGQASESAMG